MHAGMLEHPQVGRQCNKEVGRVFLPTPVLPDLCVTPGKTVAETEEMGPLMVLHAGKRDRSHLLRLGPFRKALWWQHLKKQARIHRRPDLSLAPAEADQETDTNAILCQENTGDRAEKQFSHLRGSLEMLQPAEK